jgi:hypothetical protein
MRRTSLITILVFVAGLGIGYFARSALTATLERKDLAAITSQNRVDCIGYASRTPVELVTLSHRR